MKFIMYLKEYYFVVTEQYWYIVGVEQAAQWWASRWAARRVCKHKRPSSFLKEPFDTNSLAKSFCFNNYDRLVWTGESEV